VTDDTSWSDGSRHTQGDALTAEFMFGLLDYQIWHIYLGARWIGQVTLNTVDRTSTFIAGDDLLPAYSWMQRGHLNGWYRWLQTHQAERGSHLAF
jgi:hypothetical protein